MLRADELIPRKRTAIDGKTWWCVYNIVKGDWSTYTCFGRYKTEKSCWYAIKYYTRIWRG